MSKLNESLHRITSNLRPVPDRGTTICRCGSSWRNGKEVPVGWVFVDDPDDVTEHPRGLVRRCEVCHPRTARGASHNATGERTF